MEQINNRRKYSLLTLLASFVVLAAFSIALLNNDDKTTRLEGELTQLEANRPHIQSRPAIRLLEMENHSIPEMSKVYATMILEPDKKTINIFLCQVDNAPIKALQNKPLPSLQGMCGATTESRSVMLTLALPAETDGSVAMNEKAMNEVKLQFMQMPPGLWSFTGMPVSDAQVEAFATTMRELAEKPYLESKNATTKSLAETRTNTNLLRKVRLFFILTFALSIAVLRITYSNFRSSILMETFRGEIGRTSTTDSIMPSFRKFLFGSLNRLSETTQRLLRESERRLRHDQALLRIKTRHRATTASPQRAKPDSKLTIEERLERLHLLYQSLFGRYPKF